MQTSSWIQIWPLVMHSFVFLFLHQFYSVYSESILNIHFFSPKHLHICIKWHLNLHCDLISWLTLMLANSPMLCPACFYTFLVCLALVSATSRKMSLFSHLCASCRCLGSLILGLVYWTVTEEVTRGTWRELKLWPHSSSHNIVDIPGAIHCSFLLLGQQKKPKLRYQLIHLFHQQEEWHFKFTN